MCIIGMVDRWYLYVYICCNNVSLSSSKGLGRGRNPKCPIKKMERATLIIEANFSHICTWSSKSEVLFNKGLCFRLVVSGHLQKEADFFSNFIEGERGIKEFCNQVNNTMSLRLNVCIGSLIDLNLSVHLGQDRLFGYESPSTWDRWNEVIKDKHCAFHKNVWPLTWSCLTDTDFKGHIPYL